MDEGKDAPDDIQPAPYPPRDPPPPLERLGHAHMLGRVVDVGQRGRQSSASPESSEAGEHAISFERSKRSWKAWCIPAAIGIRQLSTLPIFLCLGQFVIRLVDLQLATRHANFAS